MKKQFVLLKIHQNEILHKRYSDYESLKQDYENTDEFPGEVAAEYNLEAGHYLYLRDVHGEGSMFESIIAKLKRRYEGE